MNDAENNEQGSTLGINDILFIVFRHKFKILFFFLMAFVAAGAVWYLKPPLFESEAKILIKYVKESRIMATPGSQEVIVDGKHSVITSEIEILKSQDVAIAAVKTVGADKFLAAYGGGNDEMRAAGVLLEKLKIDAGNNSDVVTVSLGHPDPQMAQKTLSAFIEAYLHKHYEAWLQAGSYEFLLTQTDQIRASLNQTEEELGKELSKAGILSLADAKTEVTAQLNRIQKDLYETDAQLAEKRAQLDEYKRPSEKISPNNAPANLETKTNNVPDALAAPNPATVANYQRLIQQLTTFKNRELEYLSIYKDGSTNSSNPLHQIRQQIADVEKAINELGFDPSRTPQVAGPSMTLFQPAETFNIAFERSRVAALEARTRTLTNQLAEVNQKAQRIEQVENRIEDLQRKKRIYDEQYQHFRTSLEKAKIEQALDSTKLGNINVVQEPSRAGLNSKKTKKMVMMAFGGTACIGLALAFLIELLLDPSVKRAKELETRLKVQVLISVPSFKGLRQSRKKNAARADALEKNGLASEFYGEIPPWEDSDPMLPYYEALRDRVVMSYNGDNHKPKVVGLTSCNDGAGVTRLATGLAAALSRDVQRNVLLIGLQSNRVSVSAFDKGRPAEALASAPAEGNGEDPSVQENLYSLATTGRNLAGASVVQSFSDLMPKLRVSDYDFIIFDLPPISQTSGALRLASQMERTIMVVEAEKTDRRKLDRAVRLLASSRAKVSTVFNKSRSYGPKVLDEEI
jgi:succinoglycan biosynthesis transport protein ExoP